MTIPVKQNLVATSKYDIKCPYTMTAEYITVHNTYNDASAENEIKYMISNNNEVSFHVAIDDVQAIQGIPFDRNAWACGDGNGPGNRKSISVEICYSKSGGERYKKAEVNAIQYIAQLLKERGWGVDRVRKHQDWNGKYCPHRILDEKRWGAFVSAVATELASLNNIPKAAEAPVPLPPGIIGQVKIKVKGLYAVVSAGQGEIELVELEYGKVYNVTANLHDYHRLILNDKIQVWVKGDNGNKFDLVR